MSECSKETIFKLALPPGKEEIEEDSSPSPQSPLKLLHSPWEGDSADIMGSRVVLGRVHENRQLREKRRIHAVDQDFAVQVMDSSRFECLTKAGELAVSTSNAVYPHPPAALLTSSSELGVQTAREHGFWTSLHQACWQGNASKLATILALLRSPAAPSCNEASGAVGVFSAPSFGATAGEL